MSYNFCVYNVKTPDDGQRNCPKHVEFYSKNKFEKLLSPVGFIVRIYHDARSPKCQIIYEGMICDGGEHFPVTDSVHSCYSST